VKRFSRTLMAVGVVAGTGGAVTACAGVIGIGDPALDTEAGTFPPEASALRDGGAGQDSANDAVAPMPEAGHLVCGTTLVCDPPATVCCLYQTAGSNRFLCSPRCAPPGSLEVLKTFSCAKFSDCPGERCCLTKEGDATCQAQCGKDDTLLCDPAGPNTCPSGYDSCKPTLLLPTPFGYCRMR
jgi:hypothetical protein